MKKLVLASITAILMLSTNLAFAQENFGKTEKMQAKMRFEQRLNLTDKQKEKAKTIHQKGFEQIKPVMIEIGTKKKEIKEIKNNPDLDETTKNEQIDKKILEIKELNKKAREIRKKNGKDFEKILTKDQKQELAKMKEEGRARFEKKHPPRSPFGMFNQNNETKLFPQKD